MPKSKSRKSAKSSAGRTFSQLGYALLCGALVGFVVWIWPQVSSDHQTAPVKSAPPTVTAPAKIKTTAASVPLPRVPAPEAATPGARPVETILDAQIALVRQGISPGSIDGRDGTQTRAALCAFQKKHGIPPTGLLDDSTKSILLMDGPAMTEYTVTSEDLARLMPLPQTWLEKSEKSRLDFENILELLGEKAFSDPQLIRALNPNLNWNALASGARVTLPRVDYPPAAEPAAFIKISLEQCILEAFDSKSNLLVHFPCSIGRLAAKRPVGELHVSTIAPDPNYTFDPAIFAESSEAQSVGQKLVLPPGPNNPVGVMWIGLDRPGYGIHGTPAPEQVGRTESHGCFRLANWNASYLAKLVWIGMAVKVE